jgi:FAD/FMN-containing dehydrogenase
MSDGVVIDLSGMREVTVDPAARTARVGAGATWRDFDIVAGEHGLATTGGLISSTGVAGLTLGGGIGWLQRKHGLSCDNLDAATVVTASGEVVTASADQNPELLWALRGGGGNFGVVVELTFKVHPVGAVLGGMAMFPFERAREVLVTFREWCRTAPDAASMLAGLVTAPPEDFVPAEIAGGKALVIAGCWAGELEEGTAALAPLRDLDPFVDLFGPIPYPVLQTLQDAGAPAGVRNYFRGGSVADLHDEVIDVVIAHASRMSSPLSQIHLHQMGGAVGRVAADATAFGPRTAGFTYNLISTWTDPSEDARHVAANRELAADLATQSLGTRYVNFLTERTDTTVREAYASDTYARLAAVKRQWDPTNLFCHNHNIEPAP